MRTVVDKHDQDKKQSNKSVGKGLQLGSPVRPAVELRPHPDRIWADPDAPDRAAAGLSRVHQACRI